MSGRSAGELMPVVDAAVGAGVLVEAGVRLGFRHGLIRQVLYEGMPAGLRAALHVQAARMLAGAGAAPERVAAQLVSGGLNAGGWGLVRTTTLELGRVRRRGCPWMIGWWPGWPMPPRC